MKYIGFKEEIEKLATEVDKSLGYDKVVYVNVGGGVHRPHELQKTTHCEPVYDVTTRAYVYDASKLDAKIRDDAAAKFAVVAVAEAVADEEIIK